LTFVRRRPYTGDVSRAVGAAKYEGSGETLADTDIEVGSVVDGVVTGITHFGAFVQLPGGKTGLVHISEVSDSYVRDIKDLYKENDVVKVKVLSYDGRQKIGLSTRQAQPGASATRRMPPRAGGGGGGGGGGGRPPRGRMTFEDKLARFMKESDERIADLRKHTDSRRGGRGAGRA
jgi:S1 RNA binding domain protein